jgi:hypothetical protein
VVLHANADSHATTLEVSHLQQKQERQFWLGAEIVTCIPSFFFVGSISIL